MAKKELQFLIIGLNGHGKSATGNSLLDKTAFRSATTTTNFESVTRNVECSTSQYRVYKLLVVDTPGLIGTKLHKVRYLEEAAQNMTAALEMCNGGVDAILVVLKFDCTFQLQQAALDSLKKIFGKDNFSHHAIIIMSHGDVFLEDKGLNIDFQEWSQKQTGGLYQEFEGRCVLFNNRETNKDKKELQRQQIVRMAVSLRDRWGRYKVQEYCEGLISQQQATVLSEPIQESVRPPDADVDIYMGTLSTTDKKSITRWSEGLLREISMGDDPLLPHRESAKKINSNSSNPAVLQQTIYSSESPEIAKDSWGIIQRHVPADDTEKLRKMNFLLMGKTGSGKSATGNSILRHKAFRASCNTTSETKEVKAGYAYFESYKLKVVDATSETKEVKAGYADFESYKLKVVDGPGLEDTDMDKIKDTETAAENMGKAIMMCSEGVDAFLYVMAFGERFTREEKSALESLKRIFGEKYFNHVIVIITKGDVFENGKCNITFEEWCRKQEGGFRDLYINCSGRFVLFNNMEKNEDMKMAQVQKLVEISEKLHAKNGRYNNESFKNAKSEREKLILELKAPQLTEEIQEKIGLLRGEIHTYSNRPTTDRKLILQKRIKNLEDEIKQQDKNYGILSDLLTKVNKLRELLDDPPNLQKASRELEDNVSLFWRIIKQYLLWWRRLLNGAFPVGDHRNEPRS